MTVNEKWYVLSTHHNQEKRAQAHLMNQRVECLLPMFVQQSVNGGRQVSAVKPQVLFPRYIFARFDPEVIHTTTIKATRGVQRIIGFGGLPAILPDAVVEALRQGPAAPVADMPPGRPQHGDLIEITGGQFEGLDAIWHEPRGETRAILLINLMGRMVEVAMRKNSDLRFRIRSRAAMEVQPCR